MANFRYTNFWAARVRVAVVVVAVVKGSLTRNFRQYGELKSSRAVRSVDVRSVSGQSTEDAIVRQFDERRYTRAKC